MDDWMIKTRSIYIPCTIVYLDLGKELWFTIHDTFCCILNGGISCESTRLTLGCGHVRMSGRSDFTCRITHKLDHRGTEEFWKHSGAVSTRYASSHQHSVSARICIGNVCEFMLWQCWTCLHEVEQNHEAFFQRLVSAIWMHIECSMIVLLDSCTSILHRTSTSKLLGQIEIRL